MGTALYWHDDCLGHVTPPGHPEQVARLEHVRAALAGMGGLDRREAPLAQDATILRGHPQSYLDKIVASEPAAGTVQLDDDTHMSPGSVAAARRALGGAVAAVDAVMAGEVTNAFVATRPPGHHAERETHMGFCLFGNVALAAKHAMEVHGLTRVAIVDFDVHHGNGTQDLLWDEGRALFFSSHQSPLWPGTGAPDEKGAHDQVVNLPLAPMTGGAEMRAVYEEQVFPRIDTYRPELLMISAGFDAHRADPLANLNWEVADYVWLTEKLCDLAAKHCGARVVSALEGGYDLEALAESAAAHVKVLKEKGA
ncbi:histone deacetylase family protein [Lutimaribacter sp. EGI FJ00015]|uniref:Histone deacetylase family protein n=1 Tax=Lutimaribacter degradans TaxID=2945989 RepID=A0ACC5ZXS4_9RHOB|nr:histone deacetylase family protein [Lutimaribacter sp. EGI FJ00013]MCM2562842.1 histone deacetylase family protein [Lutimaribacter sp. EGI FJ00013]MCO0613999.1 histone deacetylase family protein [Lutimaribacter sp. EGI FJ00015]MCO0636971.1 histone deacetylase family protein [Lutimaribacter sp. EGI FJ00014]